MHNIYIDTEQFDFAYSNGTAILFIPNNSDYDTIETPCLIRLLNNDNTLIAVVYKKYNNKEEISYEENAYCFSEALKNTNNGIGIKVTVYKTEKLKADSLIPATLLLYRNIQWFRHLKLKRIFFRYTPTEETKTNFDYKIETTEKTIDFLNGNISSQILCNRLLHDKDKSYDFPEIIEFLHMYPDPPELNDFRKERLTEISNIINIIKELNKNKKYLEIRQAAYDIHNIPEIIRTMNDYR